MVCGWGGGGWCASFFFNDTGTTESYTLSLHDALPISPKLGWRHVKVTERRTNQDWAHCIKDLLDIHFPKAKKIVLLTDNLNTHKGASLYKAFAPEEAKRLLDKIEWHYTPKHGSWLNMAENEISVLRSQVLSRRIPDAETLEAKISAWPRIGRSTCTTRRLCCTARIEAGTSRWNTHA